MILKLENEHLKLPLNIIFNNDLLSITRNVIIKITQSNTKEQKKKKNYQKEMSIPTLFSSN